MSKTSEEWRDYLLGRPEHEAKEILAHPRKEGSEREGAGMAQVVRDNRKHFWLFLWTVIAAVSATLGAIFSLCQLLL